MDHHSLHGQDISNLSSSSPHRLPTVSAAQALQDLNSPAARYVSTGLRGLDFALRNREVLASDAAGQYGGVSRGQVTEVYGPPGVGKTALGIQLAANALRDGQGVVWVDAAHPLPGPRLKEVLLSAWSKTALDVDQLSLPTEAPSASGLLKNLNHFITPTLPHLIALLCHTAPSFPSQNTSLIVIDSLSVLVAAAYPRTLNNVSAARKVGIGPKHDSQTWAAGRKWSVLQYIISSLQRLASLRHLAIVLLNQSVTKMQSGAGAILVSAVSSTAWDAGIATSIALFRDWDWDGKQVRFARVLRANGVAAGRESIDKVLAFTIESHGLVEAQLADTNVILDAGILATPSRKRKADEIRDSEDEDDLEGSDEDYGWAEEDDGQLPQPPPQWQGSEDILVPGAEERAKEEDEEEQELDEEGENGEDDDEEVPAPDTRTQMPRGGRD